jgi:hypothetical protein
MPWLAVLRVLLAHFEYAMLPVVEVRTDAGAGRQWPVLPLLRCVGWARWRCRLVTGGCPLACPEASAGKHSWLPSSCGEQLWRSRVEDSRRPNLGLSVIET